MSIFQPVAFRDPKDETIMTPIRNPALALLLFLATTAMAGNWLGVHGTKAQPLVSKIESPSPMPTAKAPPTRSDTTYLSRQVTTIPARTVGPYLGTLEGVRCFNCTPNVVLLNLGDSISSEAATLSLRVEVWNAIERPLKDRRAFDYGNRCFFFGHKDIDTILVGGEWTEVRAQDLPCYPYLQRIVLKPVLPKSALTLAAPDATSPDTAGSPQAAVHIEE